MSKTKRIVLVLTVWLAFGAFNFGAEYAYQRGYSSDTRSAAITSFLWGMGSLPATLLVLDDTNFLERGWTIPAYDEILHPEFRTGGPN